MKENTGLEVFFNADKFQETVEKLDGHITILFPPTTKFYQTKDSKITIAIIEDSDGLISLGIARAGKTDIEAGLITSETGMNIAEGRAAKVRNLKTPLIERNYLRGVHAMKVERI
jgi:hypothetical protein